jgi:hypothetical protein
MDNLNPGEPNINQQIETARERVKEEQKRYNNNKNKNQSTTNTDLNRKLVNLEKAKDELRELYYQKMSNTNYEFKTDNLFWFSNNTKVMCSYKGKINIFDFDISKLNNFQKNLYVTNYLEIGNVKKNKGLDLKTLIRTFALSNSEEFLATSYTDGILKIWNIKTGECLFSTNKTVENNLQDLGYITTIEWKNDDTRILCSTSTGKVFVINIPLRNIQAWKNNTTTKNKAPFLTRIVNVAKKNIPINSATWSPDGRYILYNLDSELIIVDSIDFKIIHRLEHNNFINVIKWSPESSRLLVGLSNGAVYIWKYDLDTSNIKKLECLGILIIFFSKSNRNKEIYKVLNHKEYIDFHKLLSTNLSNIILPYKIKNCAWKPNSREVAIGNHLNNLTLWNISSDNISEWKCTHRINADSFNWSSDGIYFAYSNGNKVKVIKGDFDHSSIQKIEDAPNSASHSGGKKNKKEENKKKLIDTFKKTDLVKIAKKHNISLKTKDNSVKTKEQLFNSLKRKKLV